MLFQHRRTIRVDFHLAGDGQPRHLEAQIVCSDAGEQREHVHAPYAVFRALTTRNAAAGFAGRSFRTLTTAG